MQLTLHQLVDRPEFLPDFDLWPRLAGKRIAITGSQGTLGKILCSQLDRRDISCFPFQGDITEPDQVRDWIREEKPDIFFHFAAVVPVNDVMADPSKAMKTNALCMLHIMDGIKDYAPNCWVFFASTSHVYRNVSCGENALAISEDSPTGSISLYGATKLAGESICRPMADNYGTHLCIGRIFSFYHKTQPQSFLVPALHKRIREAANGASLELHNPESIRDFLDAEMVVDAILWLSALRAEGTFNIASGNGMSVGKIAERISHIEGKEINFVASGSVEKTMLIADVSKLSNLIKTAHD